MSITVEEILDGSFIDIDSSGLGSAARCFKVGVLPIANYKTPTDMEQAAINACGAPFNAPHPTQRGLYVKGYHAEPFGQSGPTLSKSTLRVQVRYQSPSGSTLNYTKIEIYGSNAQEILNRWPKGAARLAGQAILIGYNDDSSQAFPQAIDPSSINPDPNANGGNYYDTAQLAVDSPNSIIRFSRRENGSPLSKSSRFRRMVNSKPIWGFDVATVLCRQLGGVNVVGSNLIAPNLYDVIYDFEVNPNPGGWIRAEFFRDLHTGKPPPGIDLFDGTNNGYTLVLPYGLADFTALRLPSPL